MRKVLLIIITAYLFLIVGSPVAGQEHKDIMDMSLEELMNIKITTAEKRPQRISESPSTIRVITSEEIKAFGYSTIWDALKTVVGSIPSENGNNESIGFRGILEPAKFNSHILWLVDGHTMNESYFQWFFPGLKAGIDIENVARIEIIRGPASVLYGSNAFTGVVNIVTKKGKDLEGLEVAANTGGVITSSGGFKLDKSQDLLNLYSARVSFGKTFENGSDLFLSTSYTDYEGQVMYIPYFSAGKKGKEIEGADYKNTFYLLGKFEMGNCKFMALGSIADNGRPLADYGSDPGSDKNKTLLNRFFLEARYEKLSDGALSPMFRVYYDNSYYEGNWIYDGDPNVDIQKVPSAIFGFEGNISLRAGDHTLLGGIEYQQHTASQTEEYPSEENYYATTKYKYFNYAFYLQDDYALSAELTLNLGVRYETNQNYDGILLGKGALVYNPFSETTFKLQFGSAFINPLLHDYFYHSSVLNRTNNTIVELEREKVNTVELVWENTFGRFKIETVLYYSKYNNFITITPEDYYKNSNGINSLGTEVTLNYVSSGKFNGYLNFAIQSAKDDVTNETLYNSPLYSIKAGGVTKTLNDMLSIALEGQFYGEEKFRNTPALPGVENKQNPFAVVNMNFNFKPAKSIEIGLGIYNLFNSAYRYPISKGEPQSYYGKGRNFVLRTVFMI